MAYNKITTLEQIKTDVERITELTKDLKTYDDFVEFESEHRSNIELEINGQTVKDFNPNESIEYVRIECFGCLNYIYLFLDSGTMMFDVFYGDDYPDYLVQNINPEDVTKENYNKWIKAIKEN